MALALEARAMKDDILVGDTPKAVRRRGRTKRLADLARGRLWKHSTLADIEGVIAPEMLQGMFVFTLVRNPWDRVVSYYHWLQVQRFDHPAVRLARAVGFKEFVLHPHTQASFRQSPASTYVCDSNGQEHCQAFIRVEHLEADLAPVESHLGFSLDIPHVNRSEREHDYRAYYDAETARHLGEMCSKDIERFGYTFES